jgi:DNA-binding NarL/FixJ family response regulator
MNRVFLAGAVNKERQTLCELLEELDMKVVGESTNWPSVLNLGPTTHPDVVAVDWSMISIRSVAALRELRIAFPAAVLLIFPNLLDASQRSKLIFESGDFNQKGPYSAGR